MRILLFLVAFVIGVALSAPLEKWVLPFVAGPLRSAGAELRVGSLRFALPWGLKATNLAVTGGSADLTLDSVYVGLTRSFSIEGCGGHAGGSVSRDSFSLDLSAFDPSRCLRVGKLTFESAFEGSVDVEGMPLLPPKIEPTTRAVFDLRSEGGVFGGILPGAGVDGADLPLGEWEFSDLVLRATLENGQLSVDQGSAMTTGVAWELLGATFKPTAGKTDMRVDFRARAVDDTPRARALIGLLPKATIDAEGWRNYRIVGTPGAARVLGLD